MESRTSEGSGSAKLGCCWCSVSSNGLVIGMEVMIRRELTLTITTDAIHKALLMVLRERGT